MIYGVLNSSRLQQSVHLSIIWLQPLDTDRSGLKPRRCIQLAPCSITTLSSSSFAHQHLLRNSKTILWFLSKNTWLEVCRTRDLSVCSSYWQWCWTPLSSAQ